MSKKNEKKALEKNEAGKIIPALANEEKTKQKMQDKEGKTKKEDQQDDESWKQGLMKAEDAKPGTTSTLADLPKNVWVISEAAGKMNFGTEGLSWSISKDLVSQPSLHQVQPLRQLVMWCQPAHH